MTAPDKIYAWPSSTKPQGVSLAGGKVDDQIEYTRTDLTQSAVAAALEAAAEMIREYPHFMLMTPDQKKVCVHLAQVILALRDKPAPAVTVQEAARVLLTYLSETQDSVVWETTEDAMAVPMADPGDVIFSALRAIAGGGDE